MNPASLAASLTSIRSPSAMASLRVYEWIRSVASNMSTHPHGLSCKEGFHRHFRHAPGRLPGTLAHDKARQSLSSHAKIPALAAAGGKAARYMLNLPAPRRIKIHAVPHLEGLAIYSHHSEHARLSAQVLSVVPVLAGEDNGFQTIADRFHDCFSLSWFSHIPADAGLKRR
ncbi:exported hypothetical protein [Halomonas sp. A3H3]|nr:exported hypothetical protein [Halomonas sp. A3H3]